MKAAKRAVLTLCAAMLLSLFGAVFAADAGSPQDPILSKSYVLKWQDMLLKDRANRAARAGDALVTEYARSAQMLRGRCGERGMRTVSLPAGGQILLQSGDSAALLSGSGSLKSTGGALIDVTQGQTLSGTDFPQGHRLIAPAGAGAVFTAAKASRVALTGTAVVSNYTDCAPDQWFGVPVDYAAVNGLMAGTGSSQFSPGATLTRAMFVTILGRMAGVDSAKYPGVSFTDVEKGSWYAPYVEWAVKTGVTQGVGGSKFAPNTPVTREQMAALIIRYADAAGYALPDGANARASFRDESSISDWAFESVGRMRATGLLSGDEQGNFNPRSGATRAEAATVFMRLDATIRILK